MKSGFRPISVGIIGVGGMGGRHARNLHDHIRGARVAAITDVDLRRAHELADACGGARIFQDAGELIRSDEVDAVVIASPDRTHAGYVRECLRVRKPVFCEKPLATTTSDAESILAAEQELGRKLVQVGFMRRFDPQHQALKRELERGAIGRPLLYKGWHRNVETGTYGVSTETFVVNSAVHDIDAARWLLGREVEAAFLSGVNSDPALGEDVYDLLIVQLFFSGGSLATIEVYVNAAYGYEVGVEIVGDQGTALIGPPAGPLIRARRNCGVRVEGDWLERFDQSYVVELQAWIDAIRRDTHAGPDAWDGYVSLTVAEACLQSLQSGVPQRLPILERPALYRDSDSPSI